MADDQVDQEPLFEDDDDDDELRERLLREKERQLHKVIYGASREAAEHTANRIVGALDPLQDEDTVQTVIYAASRESADRIVSSVRALMVIVVGIATVAITLNYYTTNRAVNLATEQMRILVVGTELDPGLANFAARQTAEQLLPKLEVVLRNQREDHEQRLEELLQPVQTRVVPQNQPANDAAGLNDAAAVPTTTPAPAPATQVLPWDTIE